MLGRNSKLILIALLLVVFGITGCALLQNSPVVEIPSSRITCEANPQMVDGFLNTVGVFNTNASIRKMYFHENSVEYKSNPQKFQIRIDGTRKTETVIKLDKPTYIAYVEIYAGSDIPKIALDLTNEQKSPNWSNSFVSVREKRHSKVKNLQIARFNIRKEVLYLRITADGIEDRKNQKRIRSVEQSIDYEMVTPLKGSQIREVKFYEQM